MPHGVIKISSSSYELSVFSLKVGSSHGMGVGVALGELSSVTIGDLWLQINSSRGTGDDGTFMTATHGHLEASTSCLLSGTEGSKKRKVMESLRYVCEGVALE
jgi:hypothetical protein